MLMSAKRYRSKMTRGKCLPKLQVKDKMKAQTAARQRRGTMCEMAAAAAVAAIADDDEAVKKEEVDDNDDETAMPR